MCIVCDRSELAPGLSLSDSGPVAQLVERHAGSVEVRGSNPRRSTSFLPDLRPLGFMLGGFIAGEGCFYNSKLLQTFQDGSPKKRFVFCVSVASRDLPLLRLLRTVVGYGSIRQANVTNPAWLPQSVLTVNSLLAHQNATIPFMDEFLLQSAKREQFLKWKEAFEAYLAEHPPRRGRSVCSIPGCEEFVRGRGLCRSHYYQATGW